MRTFITILIISFLSGCVSPSTVLVNNRGQKVTCQASGFGLLSGTMANNRHEACVSEAQMRGYKVVNNNYKPKSSNSNDMYVELKNLKELKDSGIITQKEFDVEKQKILSR